MEPVAAKKTMHIGNHFITPFVLPIAAFIAVIGLGSCALSLPQCAAGEPVPFVDALFVSTSAVCVTGLASVDAFAVFNRSGQIVILVLIQLGGIGIVTYTSLIFYMLGRRISLRDRMAVQQGLFYNPSFHLGRFLQRMVISVLLLEAAGAALLLYLEPEGIGAFNAVFLAVSAFCNAGFAPWPDSLAQWSDRWAITGVIMSLIVLGGLGFFVADDLARVVRARLHAVRQRIASRSRKSPGETGARVQLSYYSRLVLKTTIVLILGGAAAIFLVELGNGIWKNTPLSERLLTALFQSVTSRTAGFATVDMARLSDVTLLILIMLMFVGGSPGSCAGGIKTTAFRILCSSLVSHLHGHSQVVVDGRAMDASTLNKAQLLLFYALMTIVAATFLLTVTENGIVYHGGTRLSFMDLFFEVVSAFATVGLSVNLTPQLSAEGKLILCLVMFIGKLGPVWLITTIQQFQTETAYRFPESSIPIG